MYRSNRSQVTNLEYPSLKVFSIILSITIYDEWDQKKFAAVLYHYWKAYGLKYTDIYREPNLVLSLLEDEEGKQKVLDLDGNLI